MQDTDAEFPESTSNRDLTRKGKAKSKQKRKEATERQEDQAAGSEKGKPRTDPADILRGVAGTTSRTVFQAASILEEEIAAGVVAAKQVEERLVKSSVLPAGRPNALMQRFRRDMHEVVDLVLDLVNAAADYAGMPNQPGVTIRRVADGEMAYRVKNGPLPTLVMPNLTRAGERVEVAVSLENNLDRAESFGLLSTDLVSASGNRISGRQVSFSPHSLSIGPYHTQEVVVAVSIPRGKPSGTYSGLIRSTETDRLRAVLVVQVG